MDDTEAANLKKEIYGYISDKLNEKYGKRIEFILLFGNDEFPGHLVDIVTNADPRNLPDSMRYAAEALESLKVDFERQMSGKDGSEEIH